MFSIALIGADGAGKTTIARRLESSFPQPIRYLYMGVSTESSNRVLPTSRLVQYVKRWEAGGTNHPELADRVPDRPGESRRKTGGRVRNGLRLINRLAEEWYRQYLSWRYRRKGEIVVYDRHFAFDFERGGGDADTRERWSDSLHRWLLDRFYPEPDLVLYLDAPADVLFARKAESTLEYLEERRGAFTHMASTLPNVILIDATQPLEHVYDQVERSILSFGASVQGH